MFRDIFKVLKKEAEKVIEEAEKQAEKHEKTETPSQVPTGKYWRLAAWIKSNYGDWFKDGATTEEVRQQLEKVFRERERMGDFRNNPAILKGFRVYIEGRQYGNLVRVRE
jgi:hypothetical protein